MVLGQHGTRLSPRSRLSSANGSPSATVSDHDSIIGSSALRFGIYNRLDDPIQASSVLYCSATPIPIRPIYQTAIYNPLDSDIVGSTSIDTPLFEPITHHLSYIAFS